MGTMRRHCLLYEPKTLRQAGYQSGLLGQSPPVELARRISREVQPWWVHLFHSFHAAACPQGISFSLLKRGVCLFKVTFSLHGSFRPCWLQILNQREALRTQEGERLACPECEPGKLVKFAALRNFHQSLQKNLRLMLQYSWTQCQLSLSHITTSYLAKKSYLTLPDGSIKITLTYEPKKVQRNNPKIKPETILHLASIIPLSSIYAYELEFYILILKTLFFLSILCCN